MSNETVIFIITAFLIGSIPFGWVIAKLWGVSDLRKVGSSNIGATNVVRTAGWLPGTLTFILDYLKGIGPMLYVATLNPKISVWIGVAAVLGHCYSPFLKLRGGKGVSTTLGAVTALNPWIGFTAIVIYGITLGLTRVSAIGSLFAMLASAAGTLIFTAENEGKIAVGAMVVVVLARHKDNWDKILGSFAIGIALLAPGVPEQAFADTRGLKDFRGKGVEQAIEPKRITALMPSLAEIVVELGAGEKLVGVSDYTKLPESLAAKAPKLGPYNNISAEAVYSTHPDLVLASMDGNDAKLVGILEKLGLKVVTVNTQSLSDIVRSIDVIGAAIGRAAHPKIKSFKAEVTAEKASKFPNQKRKRVFVQIGWEPLVSVSKATFIDDLVNLAGGKNVFESAAMKYPRPNPEEVIAADPDVIVICKLTETGDETERARAFWLRFTNMKAARNNKIAVIPGDWLTKPGFSLLSGLRELKRVL